MVFSVLPFHIDGVVDAAKFELLNNKLGYRVIYQEAPPCPNGAEGCAICRAKGGVVGKHPRPIAREQADSTFPVRADGLPALLAHRWRTSPVTVEVQGAALTEGQDFRIEGRLLHILTPLSAGTPVRVKYEAYAEDFVHLQHAYADFAGGGRVAEKSLNLNFANIEQGVIAMSIPNTARGFLLQQGDRFIPADATMRFTISVEKDRANLRGRHQLIAGVAYAYGLTKSGREVPLQASFNRDTFRFEIEDAEYERAIIVYDACPIYTVYLDQGEFRQPRMQNYSRLSLLIREELSR